MSLVWFLDDEWDDFAYERETLAAHGLSLHVSREAEVAADAPTVAPQAVAVLNQVTAPMGAERIALLERARLIAVTGAGHDAVDVDAAERAGIPVTALPDYCVDEVAEHALLLMLAATRWLGGYQERARRGPWAAVTDHPVGLVSGATVGLVGFGRIARAVAARVRGLGCHVVATDPGVDAETMAAHGVEPADLDAVLARAEVLSVHLPLTPATRGLLDAPRLARLRPGAVLVNTSRGKVIDEDALVAALDEGRLAGAGLDVLATEPPPPDHPLLGREDVIVTPHSSYFSQRSLADLKRRTCQQVLDAVAGRRPEGLVTRVSPEQL